MFYSPAVFTPQEGKALTSKYLKAAAKLFDDTDFHYVEQWYSERSAILEFAATVDGIHVNGIDMIHWNDDEQIVSFKVMLRPLKGLQVICQEWRNCCSSRHMADRPGGQLSHSQRAYPPMLAANGRLCRTEGRNDAADR